MATTYAPARECLCPAPQQAGSETAAPPLDNTTTIPGGPTTSEPGQSQQPGDGPTTTAPGDDPSTAGFPVGDDGSGRGRWLAILLGLLVIIAIVGFVPTTQAVRRRSRLRAVAADPIGRGEVAWDDALGALRLLGFTPTSTQTPHEFASIVERSTRDLGPIRELADDVTCLRYAGDEDGAVERAIAAQDAAAAIVGLVRTLVGRGAVIRDALDPRTLVLPAPAPLFG